VVWSVAGGVAVTAVIGGDGGGLRRVLSGVGALRRPDSRSRSGLSEPALEVAKVAFLAGLVCVASVYGVFALGAHAGSAVEEPTLDAVQTMMRKERFAAQDVAQIKVMVPPIALTMTNPEPANMLSAKFSISYAVAAAIVIGSTDITAFYPDQLVNPEIRELAIIAGERGPETVLEIGTARGGSFYIWCRSLHSVTKFVSLDLPGSEGEKAPQFLQTFTDEEVVAVRADSNAPKTRDRVAEEVGGSIDFLFFDGDHSYEGVKTDFERYSPLVGEGGMIALHDVDHEDGVRTFWQEIRDEYETETIVRTEDKISHRGHTCGIGIIFR
jgi:predicted O-methyltransferase YrrM